jgi:cytochrome c peroxidase
MLDKFIYTTLGFGCLMAIISPSFAEDKAKLDPTNVVNTKQVLGEKLFFDMNLSQHRNQSCATCHSPDHAFIDLRENPTVGKAVSVGSDGKSFGDRNTPTAMYAKFSPDFHQAEPAKEGQAAVYKGGQFLDGREKDLQGQAGGPPLNPVEMALPDKATVVQRVQENPDYITAFKKLYGDNIFKDHEKAYAAFTESIVAFEKTERFSPFSSKYDRYLRGEVKLTTEESFGESLFFSNQFTNCNQCHQLKNFGGSEGETFSNYEYHNLGTPVNKAVRAANGKGDDFIDHGLLDHPDINDAAQDGKFKVPTLRNIAVTAPYMHNGIFKDLRTVILFYDKFNNTKRTLNPETKKPWQNAEVNNNVALSEKEFKAPALSDKEVDALVAFLRTLTDEAYELLLN